MKNIFSVLVVPFIIGCFISHSFARESARDVNQFASLSVSPNGQQLLLSDTGQRGLDPGDPPPKKPSAYLFEIKGWKVLRKLPQFLQYERPCDPNFATDDTVVMPSLGPYPDFTVSFKISNLKNKKLREFEEKDWPIYSISEKGTRLVTATKKVIHLWDLEMMKILDTVPLPFRDHVHGFYD
jgi:hypothetical protein